jgi:hypothetical protein
MKCPTRRSSRSLPFGQLRLSLACVPGMVQSERGESPAPGKRGAEGQEKGKGVVARRGLEEAQSESTGRRTGTGYEVWYIRDEPSRDGEVLHPRIGCAL